MYFSELKLFIELKNNKNIKYNSVFYDIEI